MKNIVSTAIVLMLCVTPCLAKDKVINTSTDPSCAVQITSAAVSSYQRDGHPIYHAYIDYRNQTDKVIIGVSFGLDVMNSTGDFSEYPENLSADAKVKPHKENFNNMWDIYPGQASGGRIYVRKIAFSDGTTWTDDGTKQCQYIRDKR